MTEDEIVKAINYRAIDVPCCGNCKWHKDTPYECPECLNEKNMYVTYEGGTKYSAVFFPEKHEICDNFEWKEKSE